VLLCCGFGVLCGSSFEAERVAGSFFEVEAEDFSRGSFARFGAAGASERGLRSSGRRSRSSEDGRRSSERRRFSGARRRERPSSADSQ
jgi:hypothetical protein